ncbi:MAG TPA: nucleotidyltransferase family protein [Mycobacteriales bacterium]|nr:nucleotidyltransferase family protein [Mycobacteriales bacterium]
MSKETARRQFALQVVLDLATAEVVQAWRSVGVDTLLLKGPVLAQHLYDAAELRGYGDIDLLVPPEHLQQAGEVLRELGYVAPIPGARRVHVHATTWTRERGGQRVEVDLHDGFHGIPGPSRRLWDEWSVDASPVPVGGVPVSAPSAASLAVLVALHAATREPGKHKPLEDLSRAVARFDRATWRAAEAQARRLDCAGRFLTGLELIPAGRALVVEEGFSAPRSADDIVAASGVMEAWNWSALMQARGKDFWRVLATAVWPDAGVLRAQPHYRDPLLRHRLERFGRGLRAAPRAVAVARSGVRSQGMQQTEGRSGSQGRATPAVPPHGLRRWGRLIVRLVAFAVGLLRSAAALIRVPAPKEVRKRQLGGFEMPIEAADRYLVDGQAGLDDPSRHWLREEVRRTASSGPILDAGCGPGHDAGALAAELDAVIVGCDRSPTMLSVAKARHALLVQAEMARMPFGDGAFDVVYARNALEYALDPLAALAELCRVANRRLVVGFFAVRERREVLLFGATGAAESIPFAELQEFWQQRPEWDVAGMALGGGRYGLVAGPGSGQQAWGPLERDRRWTPRARARLLLMCQWRLFVVRSAMRFLSPERVSRLLPGRGLADGQHALAHVMEAAASLPWRPLCLEQSLVLASLVTPADVVLAAGRDEQGWAMHAWVDRAGERLEPVPDARAFTELRRISLR